MDGLDFQEIKKSELENEFTIGAEYYGKKYVESISVVKRQKKTIPLGQMWILATDGDHGSPDYQESGVLYLLSECSYTVKKQQHKLRTAYPTILYQSGAVTRKCCCSIFMPLK